MWTPAPAGAQRQSRRVSGAGERRRAVPEAILVEEDHPHINALGIKGVGEIGITGSADAVCHPTGIRVREARIRLENLLAVPEAAE